MSSLKEKALTSSDRCFQGSNANVVLTNGDLYSGIFMSASFERAEPEYLLKMVQLVKRGDRNEVNGVRENGQGYLGVGQEHSMSFKMKDVVDISFEAISFGPQDRRGNGMLVSKIFTTLYSTKVRYHPRISYRLRYLGKERRPGTRAPALGCPRRPSTRSVA